LEIEKLKDEGNLEDLDQLNFENILVANEKWEEVSDPPYFEDLPIIEPKINIQGQFTPCQLFMDVIGKKFIDLLVENTNAYAIESLKSEDVVDHINKHDFSRLKNWKDTSFDELKKFIAMIMSMGIEKRGSLRDYWESMPCFESYFSKIMSLNRFELLDHFIQINSKKYDKDQSIQKLIPLLKLFEEFHQYYKPSSRITIDEIIAPFAGRFKYLTYNPQKPKRWGIRVIGLADATNSFCLSLIPQFGEETYHYLDVKNLDGLVLHQAKRYSTKGTCLYIDNYYCHHSLANDLLSNGINVTGTFRTSRKDCPKIIKNSVVKKIVQKKVQSVHTYGKDLKLFKNDNNLFAAKWKSKKDITLLSSNHHFRFEFRLTTRKREVKRPCAFHEYIKFMRGIDRLNQRVHYIRYTYQSRKWWKKILYTWLAISVANCHVLYKKLTKSTIDFKAFQLAIVSGLLSDVLAKVSKTDLTNGHYPEKLEGNAKRCKLCYYLSGSYVKAKKTSYRCHSCSESFGKDIPLCILCFKDFHLDRNRYLSRRRK
jgi:hypothetical protein